MTLEPALRAAVERWVADDPDPATRDELRALLARADADPVAHADLADRFVGPLTFGTAGLRGRVGAGPNRMNRAVVIRAAAGLGSYLREHGGRTAVVGFDARHGSAAFAVDTAAVLTAAGLTVSVLPRPLPTPVLAFAVRHLAADVGVMVTASHNPPQDNGYKVYLGDGAQIVQPTDAAIAAHIDAAPPAVVVPRATGGWRTLGDRLVEAYLQRAVGLLDPAGPRDLTVAYTPLHGVGGPVLAAAFTRAGFGAPAVVAEQADPDPDFPTVAFPNPEEPGAADAVLSLAARVGADLVIASDPDADRCAVGIPLSDGSWRMLTGDDVGCLLATHLVRRGRRGTLACSLVSGSLLGRIAAAAGLPFVITLTGFKWIARAPDLVFGYEEALGYCCDPDAVRDKDGITAALLVAELAAGLRAEGRTLVDALDELAVAHGVHLTSQVSMRVADLAVITDTMRRLRASPPTTLAGRPVARVDDLLAGVDGLPPTDGLRLIVDGGRVIVRPSGTEPKVKCYLEVVEPVGPVSAEAGTDRASNQADAVAAARSRADALLEAVRSDVLSVVGGSAHVRQPGSLPSRPWG
jgi:phosphomannomutase